MTVILDSYIDWMAMNVAIKSAAEAVAGFISEASFLDRSLYQEGFSGKFKADSRQEALSSYGRDLFNVPESITKRRKLG